MSRRTHRGIDRAVAPDAEPSCAPGQRIVIAVVEDLGRRIGVASGGGSLSLPAEKARRNLRYRLSHLPGINAECLCALLTERSPAAADAISALLTAAGAFLKQTVAFVAVHCPSWRVHRCNFGPYQSTNASSRPPCRRMSRSPWNFGGDPTT